MERCMALPGPAVRADTVRSSRYRSKAFERFLPAKDDEAVARRIFPSAPHVHFRGARFVVGRAAAATSAAAIVPAAASSAAAGYAGLEPGARAAIAASPQRSSIAACPRNAVIAGLAAVSAAMLSATPASKTARIRTAVSAGFADEHTTLSAITTGGAVAAVTSFTSAAGGNENA